MVTVTVHPWMNCHVTLKQYEALAKESPEEYKYIPYIKYESGAAGMENAIMLGDAKRRILEKPEMYAAFAPELDTVYARLYAAARLGAELSARKNVLAVTLQNEGYAMEDRRGFRNLF